MSMLKKLWRFLSSMKFGMLLLGILALACVLGSVIPQGNTVDWYLTHYSQRTGALIVGTYFDDVFHSAWFLVLTVILCCNLLLCNLLRLPELILRYRRSADPESPDRTRPTVTVTGVPDPEPVFQKLGFPKPAAPPREGPPLRFAVKNRIGVWGAWVCHLGILLLIVGFTLGQTTKVEYTVYGVPGQTRPVGDTGYTVTFDDFRAEWNESGTPSQFTTEFTMQNERGERQSGEVSVNMPASAFGYKVFQNATGSAAKLTVYVHGEPIQEEYLSTGDYLVIQDTPVAVFFEGYDAEAKFDDGQTRAVYDYSLFDMNTNTRSESRYQLEGEAALQTSIYELRFSDPRDYTLLQLKRDNYTWLALLGGLITMLGLILAFYLQPRRLWAEQNEDGTWTLSGISRKGGALFTDQVKEAAGSEKIDN